MRNDRLSEIGFDMTRWKDSKQFSSWLGLCPGNKVSGGKNLSGKTKPSSNRAAVTLRMAASTLYRSPTALGAYLRRLKARKGPMKAITATAHKLAKIIYNMLRHGREYTQDTSKCEILCDSSFSFSKPLKVSNSKPYCEFSKVLRMKKSIA